MDLVEVVARVLAVAEAQRRFKWLPEGRELDILVPGFRGAARDALAAIEAAGFVLVPKAKPETLDGFLRVDGALYNGGQYMCWKPGERDICLDDRFTIEELEAFTQHVRAARPKVT